MANLPGTCAFTRALLDEAAADAGAAGMVVTTHCDQTRRGVELIPDERRGRVFLMHVPQTWQTASAYGYYLGELERLGDFLVRSGGRSPDPEKLKETMGDYEALRRTVTARHPALKGAALTDGLNALYRGHDLPPLENAKAGKISLAVIGSALTRSDEPLFGVVETLGGAIVFDGTENGEAMLPARFDRRELRQSPLEVLAAAYFFHIPAVFRRPNSALFSWIRQEIDKRAVRGVLLVRQAWCDLWHAEVHRFKEWLGVPVIDIDITTEAGKHHSVTRINALLELVG
jgi:benzoyl-CoA reductase/2-hydroxyglutaryl-CoA dehydratase subunit BcrC/BadD/HgdB